MRDLCTIQTIAKLEPIPGKDRIKLASFVSTGWRVIVDASMKEGDKVIYCEADTLLPVRPEFEFLRLRCYVPAWDGFRIRNMKMAGVYSEGIVFPLSIIEDVIRNESGKLVDGLDVTKHLGAKKYDPEALEESALVEKKSTPLWKKLLARIPFFKKILFPKKVSLSFPTNYISVSDETRVQVLPKAIEHLVTTRKYVTITEKLDGQSATYIYDPHAKRKDRFIVCSRKLRLVNPDNSNYWKIAKKYDLARAMKELGLGACLVLQGEIVGPGIQGNKYRLKELEFRVYTIKLGSELMNPEHQTITDALGIETVPVLLDGCPLPFANVEEALEYSKGYSTIAPDGELVLREGIVVRTEEPEPPMPKMSAQFSFKVINPDFALEHGL